VTPSAAAPGDTNLSDATDRQAKLFNLMVDVGHVPRSFRLSYTVPILKNNNSIYCKSVTVDDFRGISISPVISGYKCLNTVSWIVVGFFYILQ